MKYSSAVILFLLFLLHIPFLDADPDHDLSFSRDALTDEGLYTAQARNYVNGAPFNINESDAAVKSPLFTLFSVIVFKTFSPSLIVIRASVLIFSLIIFFFVFRRDPLLLFIFSVSTIILYNNFFYQHLALAEFLCASLLVSVFYCLTVYDKSVLSFNAIIFSAVLISAAWYFKFQYLYMVVWPPVFILVIGSIYKFDAIGKFKWIVRKLLVYFGALSLFLTLYLLMWYMPNRELFDYVIFNQTETLFGEGEWFQKMIDFNIEHFFMNEKTRYFTWLFCIMFLVSPLIVYKLRRNKLYIIQFVAAITWVFVEIYKPAMVYLPSRYLVVTFIAMGLFFAIVIKGIVLLNSQSVLKFVLPVLLLSLPVYTNASHIVSSYLNRKYYLKKANEFVAENTTKGCIIIGPWAASVSWKAELIAIPVWSDYFNDHNIIEKFKPCVIVSELNQEDSGGAFEKDNISLIELSVKKYEFRIRDWNPYIYIIK